VLVADGCLLVLLAPGCSYHPNEPKTRIRSPSRCRDNCRVPLASPSVATTKA